MSFKIIDLIEIPAEELEVIREVKKISTYHPTLNRRQVLSAVGMGAAAVATSSLPMSLGYDEAKAQILDLIKAIFEGVIKIAQSIVQISEQINATFTLVNTAADVAEGAVRDTIQGIRNGKPIDFENRYQTLSIPPLKKAVISTKDLHAPETPGKYRYISTTDIDQSGAAFTVKIQ